MQYTRNRTRTFYSTYFPPGVKWLIIANTAIFIPYYVSPFGIQKSIDTELNTSRGIASSSGTRR